MLLIFFRFVTIVKHFLKSFELYHMLLQLIHSALRSCTNVFYRKISILDFLHIPMFSGCTLKFCRPESFSFTVFCCCSFFNVRGSCQGYVQFISSCGKIPYFEFTLQNNTLVFIC